MKHILICGERGAGKTTLIERLIARWDGPVYGFVTKRMKTPDEGGFFPVYLYPAGEAAGAQSLVGRCDSKRHSADVSIFDTLGAEYIKRAQPGGVIVMDELGFMEVGAHGFTSAVFSALDGDIPVIAAVKARFDVPFLNAVRAHPKAQCYDITPDNREALFDEIAGKLGN